MERSSPVARNGAAVAGSRSIQSGSAMTKTAFGFVLLLMTAALCAARADPVPPGGVGQNVEVIGYSNLDDRPGFKMSIVESNGRWYLYMGHLWHFGWSIVDVTDPVN